MRSRGLLAPIALAEAGACARAPAGPPAPAAVAPARPLTEAACAALLRVRHAIDVTPEPRICLPLAAALAPLGPASLAEVHGLVIVRDARGPCGDRCPDLASALRSDAALAYYRTVEHALHVVDATFAGPRWRGGTPDAAAVRAYLDGLGLPDWDALVARVRALPGAALPAVVPPGSPVVFDAIVRHGPAQLLGGEVPLVDLLRHELGHAVLLRHLIENDAAGRWSSVTGWVEADGEVADGFVGGVYASELPIVASRLVLGLSRGAAARYRPSGPTPTGYGAFDPMEDHAEAFRLVHADPVALGRRSPARLLIAAAGELDLRAPRLVGFVRAGVAALLADRADPVLAMAVLRAHRAALVPAAADLADPRPLPIPASVHPDVRAALDAAVLVVEVDGLRFRPSDAAIAAFIAEAEAWRVQHEELQRLLDAP
jgi:hypothetical protein